jgi:hypothetical protein
MGQELRSPLFYFIRRMTLLLLLDKILRIVIIIRLRMGTDTSKY